VDTLLGHHRLVVDGRVDERRVPGDGLAEVAHRDPDMVDPDAARHGSA
jgi:hypothetical protein